MIEALSYEMATNNLEDPPSNADLVHRLWAMVRFLPAQEDADFAPGKLSPIQKTESGSFVMPHVTFSKVANHFIRAAYDLGWVLRGFDWVLWAKTDEAKALCNDHFSLTRAPPEQLFYLITALIRQDRFRDGAPLESFKSGLILGIVRRAAAILKGEQ